MNRSRRLASAYTIFAAYLGICFLAIPIAHIPFKVVYLPAMLGCLVMALVERKYKRGKLQDQRSAH
jgi:hypothetical protein